MHKERGLVMKCLKVVSLFSGIGAYEKALYNIGVQAEIVNYCEILSDKSKAYSILHNVSEEKNLKDVTAIDIEKIGDFDLLCYSPPCISYSIAGKKDGMNSKTGPLFYDSLRVIKEKQPKYCVMENVANLPRRFTFVFEDMLESLSEAGYNNYWKIINAKDFIPQNRERVYLIRIRKDIDDGSFQFLLGNDSRNWWDVIDLYDMRPLTNRQQRKIDYVMGKNPSEKVNIEGVAQFDNSVITLRQSGLRFQSNREYPTITAYYGKGGGNFTIIAKDGKVLGGITPKNCFRLMGFDFEDCEKLEKEGFTKSSLYVMAGDSVCVPVLENIFKNLFHID